MHSGLAVEFDSSEAIVRAYERLREKGYVRLRAWTPYPVRALIERMPPSPISWWMMAGALLGGGVGYLIQWWTNARSFPIDVGGRPLDSVPAFIPITFESAVLASSLTGFFAMLAKSGLPRLYDATSEIPGFDRASVDRFWLAIDVSDPAFDHSVAVELLELGALRCEPFGRRA